MTESQPIRLLEDPPLDGPSNMSRDEALLLSVGRGQSPPTLRLYEWSPPTLSLGYFQRYAEFEAMGEPAGELSVVRRLTGGGAILHDQELTYSMILPRDHGLLDRGANQLYELVHAVVMDCMEGLGVRTSPCGVTDDSGPRRGPFFCFERRHKYDVLVGEDKLAGSAQRRCERSLLQHGSVICAGRYAQQSTVSLSIPAASVIGHLRASFPASFERISGVKLRGGSWSKVELEEAKRLHAKYAGNDWTRRC